MGADWSSGGNRGTKVSGLNPLSPNRLAAFWQRTLQNGRNDSWAKARVVTPILRAARVIVARAILRCHFCWGGSLEVLWSA